MTTTTTATLNQAAKDAALALAKAIAACVAHEVATTTDKPHQAALAEALADAPEFAELLLEDGYAHFEDSQVWDIE